jgi:NAD(P)-dependent dehydrogenase (short-subunit alcohol dehydrogenase family)
VLAGCRALVTGGSSGIGAATALALAEAGASVVITGRDAAALERVAQRIEEVWVAAQPKLGATVGGSLAGPDPSAAVAPEGGNPPRVVTVVGDLRRPGVADEVVDAAVAALGGMDIVVSNAGVGWAGSLAAMTAAEIDQLVDLNLRAPLHLVHAALPHLVKAGESDAVASEPGMGDPAQRLAGPRRRCVVLVGSIAGHLGVREEAVYSATKAGVVGLADALRWELAGTGIGVTLVTPGAIETSFFEHRNRPYERVHPRPVAARVVANAIVDGVIRRRPEVTIPAWLTMPVRLRGTWPRLYWFLARRFG